MHDKVLESINEKLTQLVTMMGSQNKAIKELQVDVRVLKEDVSELKVDVSQLKGDVFQLQTEQGKNEARHKEVLSILKEIKADQDFI